MLASLASPRAVPSARALTVDPCAWTESETWLQERAYEHWLSRGQPSGDDWADWLWATLELEREFAAAQGENCDWIAHNLEREVRARPAGQGEFAAVASRTETKILATADDWDAAWQQALDHPELLEAATREGLPASVLLTVAAAGDC
jgi:hypothetical protein